MEKNPFRKLHPTLKICRCGFIGTSSAFHNHMEVQERELVHRTGRMSICAFFERHGESLLYEDDERLKNHITKANLLLLI
jgi:hypothetical protein